MMDILTSYLRLLSYSTVILISLFRFKIKRFDKGYLVANVFMGLSSLVSLIVRDGLGLDSTFVRTCVITPGAVLWGTINMITFLREHRKDV